MIEEILTEALAMLVPPVCRSCGCEPLRGRDVLCGACTVALVPLTKPCCSKCGLPAPCAPCPAIHSPWDTAVSAFAHEGPSRGLVQSLKQSGSRRVAALMAGSMVDVCPPGLLGRASIVSVPPHPSRRRKTGVDHARELAKAVSRQCGRPLARPLRRGGPVHQQAGARRNERMTAGRIIVTPVSKAPIAVVLVDDVHTTGATFAACAAALRAAGCMHITCLSFARAL